MLRRYYQVEVTGRNIYQTEYPFPELINHMINAFKLKNTNAMIRRTQGELLCITFPGNHSHSKPNQNRVCPITIESIRSNEIIIISLNHAFTIEFLANESNRRQIQAQIIVVFNHYKNHA